MVAMEGFTDVRTILIADSQYANILLYNMKTNDYL